MASALEPPLTSEYPRHSPYDEQSSYLRSSPSPVHQHLRRLRPPTPDLSHSSPSTRHRRNPNHSPLETISHDDLRRYPRMENGSIGTQQPTTVSIDGDNTSESSGGLTEYDTRPPIFDSHMNVGGQNHDREDSEMDDAEDEVPPEGHDFAMPLTMPVQSEPLSEGHDSRLPLIASLHHVSPAPSAEEELMDTSPDGPPVLGLSGVHDSSNDGQSNNAPMAPPRIITDGLTRAIVDGENTETDDEADTPVGGHMLDLQNPTVSSIPSTGGESAVTVDADHTRQADGVSGDGSIAPSMVMVHEWGGSTPPPPDAPPMSPDSTSHDEEEGDDNEERDNHDDEDDPYWSRFEEDRSEPSPQELQEIEKRSSNVGGNDHEHWETAFYEELDDPEYVPTATGRIQWIVKGINGTSDQPNKQRIMLSPSIVIGGYYWNLKYYPRGNDGTSQFSIYLECAKSPHEEHDTAAMRQTSSCAQADVTTALPLLPIAESDSSPMGLSNSVPSSLDTVTEHAIPEPQKDGEEPSNVDEIIEPWEVAAQFGCVVYSPNEPRVHHSNKSAHLFCSELSDWGWTRFHGPWSEIHKRQPFERQALLRDDTLAFTAYIRIIKDDTRALFWHAPKDNPQWDSFSKTGLRPLSPESKVPSGLSAAIATWTHLEPMKRLLFETRIPHPLRNPDERPRALHIALQRFFRSVFVPHRDKAIAPISLRNVSKVLNNLEELKSHVDPIQMLDILTQKLDREAFPDRSNDRYKELILSLRQPDPMTEAGHFQLVVGPEDTDVHMDQARHENTYSVQDYVDCLDYEQHPPPSVIQIELGRQRYDYKTRTWQKLTHKIKMDEVLNFNGVEYYLKSFIVHSGDLESGEFFTIAQLSGPGSGWLKHGNVKERHKIVRLTRKQAIHAHEGAGEDRKGCEAVAYVAHYVRNDIVSLRVEKSTVESNTCQEVRCQAERSGLKLATVPSSSGVSNELIQIHIFHSELYMYRTGLGVLDPWDQHIIRTAEERGLVTRLTLPASASLRNVQEALSSKLEGVDKPEQCRLWIVDATSNHTYVNGSPVFESHYPECNINSWGERTGGYRLWLKIIPIKDVLAPTTTTTPSVEPPAEPHDLVTESGPRISEDPPLDLELPQEESSIEMRRHETIIRHDTPPAPTREDVEMENSHDIPLEIDQQPDPPLCEPWGAGVQPSKDILIFIKEFKPHSQMLTPVNCILLDRANLTRDIHESNILETICDIPAHPEKALDFFLERRPVSKLTPSDLSSLAHGDIIVFQERLTERQKELLVSSGAYVDVISFIAFSRSAEANPTLLAPERTSHYFGGPYLSGPQVLGRPHGHCTRVSLSGDHYKGNFVSGLPEGKGEMRYSNGNTYTGNFVADAMNGQGTMVYAETGNRYVGGWKAGRRHGKGRMDFEVSDEEMSMCRICYEAEMDAVLVDCGHVVACEECARQVEVCPVCRRAVKMVVRFWKT